MVVLNPRHSNVLFICAVVIAAVIHLSHPACGQEAGPLKYMMPPKAIADLIDAPPTPYVSISPDNRWM